MRSWVTVFAILAALQGEVCAFPQEARSSNDDDLRLPSPPELSTISGQMHFGRPVLNASGCNPSCEIHTIDDIQMPTTTVNGQLVSCIVFRGVEKYYVEVHLANQSSQPQSITADFIRLEKAGYTVVRVNTLQAAQDVAATAHEDAGRAMTNMAPFVPIPPPAPKVPPTTIRANAWTYGNNTTISGTVSSTPTLVEQIGNAQAMVITGLMNRAAADRYYATQAQNNAFLNAESTQENSLAQLLMSTASELQSPILAPGETRVATSTFMCPVANRSPCRVVITVGGTPVTFSFSE